jgi:hypothetical protein
MTALAISRPTVGHRAARVAVLPLVLLLLAVAAAAFIVYALWPSWQKIAAPLEVPSMPITVAGVLFDVPPAAIRNPVQRQPGPQERIDLAFPAPHLTLPAAADKAAEPTDRTSQDASDPSADANGALFVTITELGSLMPPAERLRTIYPHYVEAQAQAGPKGLTVQPFRAGSPYDGEDLIYPAADPTKFFARCTRRVDAMPGTCIHERTIGGADITLRFPRAWLADWQTVDAAIDRLIAKLHPN